MELIKIDIKYVVEGRQKLMFNRTKQVYGDNYCTFYRKGENNENFKNSIEKEELEKFTKEIQEEYAEKGYICKRELFENWYFHHIDKITVKVRRMTPCTTKEVIEKLTPNEIIELYGNNIISLLK